MDGHLQVPGDLPCAQIGLQDDQLVGLLSLFDPGVPLLLRVDQKRAPLRVLHDDRVVNGELVVRQFVLVDLLSDGHQVRQRALQAKVMGEHDLLFR